MCPCLSYLYYITLPPCLRCLCHFSHTPPTRLLLPYTCPIERVRNHVDIQLSVDKQKYFMCVCIRTNIFMCILYGSSWENRSSGKCSKLHNILNNLGNIGDIWTHSIHNTRMNVCVCVCDGFTIEHYERLISRPNVMPKRK